MNLGDTKKNWRLEYLRKTIVLGTSILIATWHLSVSTLFPISPFPPWVWSQYPKFTLPNVFYSEKNEKYVQPTKINIKVSGWELLSPSPSLTSKKGGIHYFQHIYNALEAHDCVPVHWRHICTETTLRTLITELVLWHPDCSACDLCCLGRPCEHQEW